MDKKPKGLLSLVLVPAILTLIVTVLRLVGELQGWSPTLVGTGKAGGGGALLGISWLIFVFGLYFGFRIQRAGAGVKSPGRTLLLSLIPVALLAGGFALLMSLELVVMPTKEVPGTVQGMPWFLGLLGLGAVVAIAIWPRLGLTLLVYALLARLPVVVVTWLALQNGWENTHYVAIAPEFTPPPADERLAWLIAPQLTAWPVATIVGGTVAGALGALLGRRRG